MAEISLYCFFIMIFRLYSEIFINFDKYANEIINLHIRPSRGLKVHILGYPGPTHSVPTECSGYGMGHAWVTEDEKYHVLALIC